MNERERIIDLVKKGIISSEEALVLLENLDKQANANLNSTGNDSHNNDEHVTATNEKNDENDQTAKLDELNEKKQALKAKIIENYDILQDLPETDLTDDQQNKKDELTNTIHDLEDQVILIEGQISQLNDQTSQKNKRDQAQDVWNNFNDQMVDAGKRISSAFKQTAQSIAENVDWREVKVKVPGIAKTTFDHEFNFEDVTASILTIRVNNGNVTLKSWDQPNIRVQASIQAYGKGRENPLQDYLDHLELRCDEDSFVYKITDRQFISNLTIFLPQRVYDYAEINLFNGNLLVDQINGKDLYVKNTNGNLDFRDFKATMLEAETVSGVITLKDTDLMDALLNTVNGDIRMHGNIENSETSTVNGNLVLDTPVLKRLKASAINGNFKIIVSPQQAIDAQVKSRFGKINNLLKDSEMFQDPEHQVTTVQRLNDSDQIGKLSLKTTSGKIVLTDR